MVGGGVTGLTAAYALERDTDFEITILESSDRVGGKIQTWEMWVQGDRFLVEAGPDAMFSRKPWAIELAEELGLQDQIIEPSAKEFSMLIDGKLHRVPGGLVTLTYAEPDAVAQASFLSDEAKRAVLNECEAPAGDGQDESIATFFRRRFGQEFSRLVAEPLLAGTHGGHSDQLSMKALYPAYFELEQKYGSLAAGMGAAKAAKGERKRVRPTFVSFTGGMETLVKGITDALKRTQILLNSSVERIRHRDGVFSLETAEGTVMADAVILAIPSIAASDLIRGMAPDAADAMGSINHASSAVVTLGYRSGDLGNRPQGTGFLVPDGENCNVTGATWSSIKWRGRAPADTTLVRVFLGRAGGVDLENDDDSRLVSVAREAFEGIAAASSAPSTDGFELCRSMRSGT